MTVPQLVDGPVRCPICGASVDSDPPGKLDVIDIELDQGRMFEVKRLGVALHHCESTT